MGKKLALIVGGAILVLSSFAVSMNIRGRPSQPSELRTPVIESPLYLSRNYEEERANLSTMANEYTESLSLWNEARQGKRWQIPVLLVTGLVGAGVFFSGVDNKKYSIRKNPKTKGIIAQIDYKNDAKRH